jgi:pyridoxal phosphate enzyme (YggS family)
MPEPQGDVPFSDPHVSEPSASEPHSAQPRIESQIESLRANAADVQSRIAAACERSGRKPSEVQLIWVSKTHSRETLLDACAAGAKIFGENRVQEVLEKFPLPPRADGSVCACELHLIGTLQRNKVRKVLPLCTAVHSIDSAELWQTCDRIAGELGFRRDVFLQVNTSREDRKSGFAPETFFNALAALPSAPNLRLVGLMTMAPMNGDLDAARKCFRELRALLLRARELEGDKHPYLAHLSMGMSGDFEVAVEEGATLVRVGTALFGKR